MVNHEPERSYRSPLREAQAGQTRTTILEAVAALVAAGHVDDISFRAVAEEAAVSERTVYRHFPDRKALNNGLAEWVAKVMRTAPMENRLEDVDDLADMLPLVFERFDTVADATRASIFLDTDPRTPTENHAGRTVRFDRLIASSFSQLGERDRLRLLGLVRALTGTRTWLLMKDEFGMSGREAGETVAWMLRTAFAEIRANGRLQGVPGTDGERHPLGDPQA